MTSRSGAARTGSRAGKRPAIRRVSASTVSRRRASTKLTVANQIDRAAVPPLITLLTDFGIADHFVAAMKGVILSLSPATTIIDLTHQIPPQDILAGAFSLLAAYQSFPPGTIHVGVVDPGVGSPRRPLLAIAGGQSFVGPDNGLFSYILDRESEHQVFHLTQEKYFRQPVSRTFHGRDIFAPVAAALSSGIAPADLGREVADCVRLPSLRPARDRNRLRGRIIHIDHFGNCITNLTRQDLSNSMIRQGATVHIGKRQIKSWRRYFADRDDGRDGLFAIWGSADFMEIAAFKRSAARILKAERGQEIVISLVSKNR